MKKINLKKMALLGAASAIALTASACSASSDTKYSSESTRDAPLTEQEFLAKLNPETKAEYMQLDDEGKALALQLANQSCKGQNSCKGLNSCKTAKNDCAGQGGCKGTSAGPFKDKNVAVKVAEKHMAEKREGAEKS